MCARAGAFALAAALMFGGCGDTTNREEEKSSTVDSTSESGPFAIPGSSVVDSVSLDVNGDGAAEIVLLSVSDSLERDGVLQGSFDRVDIVDTTGGRATRLFFDPVEDGRTARGEDVTGDGVPELIVGLDAGGNNPISSRGMHVYGLSSDGKVTLLFYSSSGAPELQDLNGDGVREILVSDQFWGMMTHADVIGYTREIYAFDGTTYVNANRVFTEYFDRRIEKFQREYVAEKQRAHETEESRLRLYRCSAELLVWSYARGGSARLARLWRLEESYLRTQLFEEQYDDLSAYVDEVTAMDMQQRRQVS